VLPPPRATRSLPVQEATPRSQSPPPFVNLTL
jgi:hypothetical protein